MRHAQLPITFMSNKCQDRNLHNVLPTKFAHPAQDFDKHDLESVNLDVLTGNPLLERIQYFAQRKKGPAERIFWLIAFVLSVAYGISLIYRVLLQQARHPVIVTFQSEEQHIDSIPFPAVTICNMNLFPKQHVVRILQAFRSKEFDYLHDWLRLELDLIKSLCNFNPSFAKHFKFANKRGKHGNESDNHVSLESIKELMMQKFMVFMSQPCKELIKLCRLGGQTFECSLLFKPVLTDHGLCCTFNMLPTPLLFKENWNESVLNIANEINQWPDDVVRNWTKWDYKTGYVQDDPDQMYPWKANRAGLPFGLSVLVNPDPKDYFCSTSDSKGIRYILHSPLELPHITDLASIVGINKEVNVEVHPDMTTADRNIEDVDDIKRNCYFGWEKQLKFYKPYTSGNCIEECAANVIGIKCGCGATFHLPTDAFFNLTLCNMDPESEDFKCVKRERRALQKTIRLTCQECRPLCMDIAYNYETTTADLQDNENLWEDPSTDYGDVPDWANNEMSVIHFFYGSESTIPKVRQLRQSQTDLIAAIGGILGLCIGFSVLSFVEIAYFIVYRSLLKYTKLAWRKLKRRLKRKIVHRTVSLNPSKIHVHSLQTMKWIA